MGPQEKQTQATPRGSNSEQATTPTSDRTTRISGTDLTLRDFGVNPSGEATTSGIGFTRDVRRGILAGVVRGDLGPSHSFFQAPASVIAPSQLPLDQVLDNLGVKKVSGAVDVRGMSGSNVSQGPSSPFGQLFATGDGFKYSAGVSRSGISMGYAGTGMEEFSQWLSSGQMKFSQATIGYNGQVFVLTPTFTIQQIPGVSFTPATSIGSIFQAIDGQSPLYSHSLSGQLNDPDAGLGVGGSRIFMNSYSLSDQPGASVVKLDLVPNDNLSNLSVILGSEPSMGNFLGVRSIFEGYERHGVFSSPGNTSQLSPYGRNTHNYYFLQSDMLYSQQPDGAHRIGGSAKLNYEGQGNGFSINFKLDRELENFLQGGRSGAGNTDWNGSFFIEFRR